MTPEQALLRIYLQTAKRLRRQIRAALANEAIGTAAYRQRQLTAIETELRALGQKARRLAPAAAIEAYTRGAGIADMTLEAAKDVEVGAAFTFTGTHPAAADAIARNLANKLGEAPTMVGRRTEDAFRRVGLEVVGQGVAGGETRREVTREFVRKLIEENVTDAMTGFVDNGGKRWALDTYGEMVARTTTREAMTAGTIARIQEVGHDLVTVSKHPTSCDICEPYQGKTYSLTGRTRGYKLLPLGGPPFHPYCRHVIGAGTGDLGADLDALELALAGAAQ